MAENDNVIPHPRSGPPADTSLPPLKSSGGGGTFDGMETRVKRLEDDLKEIKGDLKALLRDSAEMKGKLSGLPSTWQIVGIVGAMLSISLASGAVVFAAVRFFAS